MSYRDLPRAALPFIVVFGFAFGCISKGNTVIGADGRDDDSEDENGSDSGTPANHDPDESAENSVEDDDDTSSADETSSADDTTSADDVASSEALDDGTSSDGDSLTLDGDSVTTLDDDVTSDDESADAGEPEVPSALPEGTQLTTSFSDKQYFDVAGGEDGFLVTWVTSELLVQTLYLSGAGDASGERTLELAGAVAPSPFNPNPMVGRLRAAVAYSAQHIVGPAYAVAWLNGDAMAADLYFQWFEPNGEPTGDPESVLQYEPPMAGLEATGTLEIAWSGGVYGIDLDTRDLTLVTVTEDGVGTLHPPGRGVLYDLPLANAGDGSFLKLVETYFTHTAAAPQGPRLYRFDDSGLLLADGDPAGVLVVNNADPDNLYPLFPYHGTNDAFAEPPWSTVVWDGAGLSVFSDASGNEDISGMMYHRVQLSGAVGEPKELEPTDRRPLAAVYNEAENELAVLATSPANNNLYVGRYEPGGTVVEALCLVSDPRQVLYGKLFYDGVGYRAFYSALGEDDALQVFTIEAECAAPPP